MRNKKDKNKEHFISRELSWLAFAKRVLALAEAPEVPLLERIKFVGIVGMLHDEFFMKRMSGLKRQIDKQTNKLALDGRTPREEFDVCRRELVEQVEALAKLLDRVLRPALRDAGIPILTYGELSEFQQQQMRRHFKKSVMPILTPLAVDPEHPFPFISNLGLNIGVWIEAAERSRFVRVKVPANLPRWVALPDGTGFTPLEQVIVANIDMVWIIQAVRLPRPNPGFIDRVLVTTEAHEIEAGLVINKIDLIRKKDRAYFDFLNMLYTDLGYRVLLTSAKTGEGVEVFREALTGQTSVVTGPSGVGKSTLLNVVEPGLDLRTGEVSEKTRKGRHTTANAALFPLSDGGFVVDTPGIREFGVLYLEPWELSHYFPEFLPHLEHCRFPTCTHDHEPDCAVIEATLDDAITEERYYSYLNILHSIRLGKKDVGR